jgi:hypothetical protein
LDHPFQQRIAVRARQGADVVQRLAVQRLAGGRRRLGAALRRFVALPLLAVVHGARGRLIQRARVWPRPAA